MNGTDLDTVDLDTVGRDSMSAAHSASSHVRRSAMAAPTRPPLVQRSAGRGASFMDPDMHDGNDLKLDLSDLPRMQNDDMEVEGLKPSLFSRLLDLVSPSSRR